MNLVYVDEIVRAQAEKIIDDDLRYFINKNIFDSAMGTIALIKYAGIKNELRRLNEHSN